MIVHWAKAAVCANSEAVPPRLTGEVMDNICTASVEGAVGVGGGGAEVGGGLGNGVGAGVNGGGAVGGVGGGVVVVGGGVGIGAVGDSEVVVVTGGGVGIGTVTGGGVVGGAGGGVDVVVVAGDEPVVAGVPPGVREQVQPSENPITVASIITNKRRN